jgi:hypothetical protein
MESPQSLYNIRYNGRAIYQRLSLEDCSEVLQDLSELFFSGEELDPNLIELEPLSEN